MEIFILSLSLPSLSDIVSLNWFCTTLVTLVVVVVIVVAAGIIIGTALARIWASASVRRGRG